MAIWCTSSVTCWGNIDITWWYVSSKMNGFVYWHYNVTSKLQLSKIITPWWRHAMEHLSALQWVSNVGLLCVFLLLTWTVRAVGKTVQLHVIWISLPGSCNIKFRKQRSFLICKPAPLNKPQLCQNHAGAGATGPIATLNSYDVLLNKHSVCRMFTVLRKPVYFYDNFVIYNKNRGVMDVS